MTNKPSLLSLITKSIFILILVRITYVLISRTQTYIFLDCVNLLIHEAGHLVFRAFGEFPMYLGGTLMQLIIPSLFIFYFLSKRDFFATFFSLFWFGQNYIGISYYLADAKDKVLPLLHDNLRPNKEGHDWAYILPKLGLLDHAKLLGEIIFWIGGLIMVFAIVCAILHTVFGFIEYLDSRSTKDVH